MNLARELLSYNAEQDRLKILERQRQGIAIAKKEGKYKDTDKFYRPDSPNSDHRAKYHRIMQMLEEEKPVTHIAADLEVSRNTIYRIKKITLVNGKLKFPHLLKQRMWLNEPETGCRWNKAI